MTDILQIFSGNPMSTFIGKKIEAATRPELESEDWGLNLEICDIINDNDDDAKDAVRAIRKRLQQIEQDRNFTITNRTLTVLETCISNCSRRFHVLVMTKDFIQDLVKLIGPKNNPPIDLQERVLRLIERWAEAFRGQPDLSGVVVVYNDLKAKGVTFPPKDPNANVPIQTPQRSVPPNPQPQPIEHELPGTRSDPRQHPPVQPGSPVVLEGEGYNKISQDLAVVQTSIDMFNEIMRSIETEGEESDWQLASDLNSTCRQMKDRIVNLIERVANEDLTIDLLRLNDDLNNIFTKYDRLVKNRTKSTTNPMHSRPQEILDPLQSGTTSSATESASRVTKTQTRTENELSLIDFNADDTSGGDATAAVGTTTKITASKPQASQSKAFEAPLEDPFDTSRILSSVGGKSTPLAQELSQLNLGTDSGPSKTAANKPPTSNLPEEISSVREQDFAEIENWLSTDSNRNLGGDSMPSIEPISIPNSEFENFIASRALAGAQAPPVKSSDGSGSSTKHPEPSS